MSEDRTSKNYENQLAIRAWGSARVNAVGGDVSAQGDVHVGDRYSQSPVVAPPADSTGIEITPKKRDLKSWVNREQVQRKLLERVADDETILVEMVGPGGAGKTSLAVWLRDMASERRALVVWMQVWEDATFHTAARWMLTKLGVQTEEQANAEALAKALVSILNDKKCLLVLDQLERIAAAEVRTDFEDFLMRWRQRGQRSTVLVTTRQPFVNDEMLSLRLSGFTPSEGEVFLNSQEIVAESSDLQALTKICGGHPLLLKLSASWLKETSKTLDAECLRFFERLFTQDLGEPDSEAQVDIIFKKLIKQLSERIRRVLLDVSVYRVSFGLEMAQAMVPETTQEDLEGLEAQGFLLVQEEKWRLHPLVDELIVEALRKESAEETAHRKAIEYFKARLEAEETDIQDYLECFHHYCECREFEAAYDVINLCSEFLNRQGYYRVLVSIYERFAEWETSQLPNEVREKYAYTLVRLGSAYDSLGAYDKAIDYQQQSLTIFKEIGDRNGEANSLGNLGIAYSSLGAYDKAIDYQQQSLSIFKEIGDRNGEAISLLNLGIAYAKIDDHWKSLEHFEQAKALFTTLKLDHIVEKCEKIIQERNQIISPTPIKAPPLPKRVTEPDWRKKSQVNSPTQSSKSRSLPNWLPYLLLFAIVAIVVITLQ